MTGRSSWSCRTALRRVRRNPAFSAIAIAMLALGIGASTAIFEPTSAHRRSRALPAWRAARVDPAIALRAE